MKVLTINHNDKNGGAARAAIRIVNALEENYKDVENTILVKHKSTSYSKVIESSVYNKTGASKLIEDIVWKVKNRIRKHKWEKYGIDHGAYLSDLFSIDASRALGTIEYDIIHLHWINEQFLDLKLLNKMTRPIIWTLHDCWPFTGICHYFYDCSNYKKQCGSCQFLNSSDERDLSWQIWKEKLKVYNNCQIHVVSPSNWLANAAKESTLFSQYEIHVIPNCVDTNIYRPIDKNIIREILGLKKDVKYLLFGALNASADINKGFQYIKESLKYLSESNHQNIELLLIGSNEVKKGKLLGLQATYLGYLYDDYSLSAFYNAADVTLVSSLSENLSNVIMESMSCGTPVVAFDVGGNSDMIEHKKNGYLAKPFDVEGFAEGVSWCINNKNQVSLKARDKVLDCFTEEIVAKMYFDLYTNLIS